MAIETTTLTGDIGTLTGADPTNCRVRLTLTESATDQVTGEIITAGSITEQAASDGTFSIVAWPNDRAPTDRAFYTFEVLVGSDVVYARQKLIVPTSPDPCTLGHVIDISEHLVAPKNLAFTQTLDALSGSEEAGDEVGTLYADGDYFIDWDLVEGRQYFQLGADGASIALKSVPPFGTYTVRVRARNIAGAASQTFVFTLGAAPEAFAAGGWNIAATASLTGDAASLTLVALPSGNGEAVTSVQYRVNGGSPVALAGVALQSYALTGLPVAQEISVELRAVNAIGAGAWSAVKTVTTAFAQPSPFTVGMWSVASTGAVGGNGAAVTILSLPDQGAAPISDIEARVDGGTWTSLGGASTGVYAITVPSFETSDVEIRSVNASGQSNASDLKVVDTRTVPAAFTAGQWSIAAAVDAIDITVTALPALNGGVASDIEARVDGGAWTSLGGAVTGSYQVAASGGAERDVEIRIVTNVGAGPESDVKAVQPLNTFTISAASYSAPATTRIADSGRHAGANRAFVPVPALTAGTAPADAVIEARIVRSDTKLPVTDYATVGTMSGGSLTGAELSVPTNARQTYKLDMEIRVAGSSESIYAGEFAIGTKVLLMAQSEIYIWSTTGTVGSGSTPAALPADPEQIVVARYDSVTTVGGAGSDVTATTPGVHALAAGLASGLGGMNQTAAELLKYSLPDYTMIAAEAISGTGQVEQVDDADDARRWVDLTGFLTATGVTEGWAPGVVIMPWWQNLKDRQNVEDFYHSMLTGRRLDGSTCTTGQSFTIRLTGSATTETRTADHFYFDVSGGGRGLFDHTRTQMLHVGFGGEAIQTVAQGGSTLFDQGTTIAAADALAQENLKRVVDTVFATAHAQSVGSAYHAPWPLLWGNGPELGIHQNDSLDGYGLIAVWLGHMIAGALNLHSYPYVDTTVTVSGDKTSATISSPAGALTSTRALLAESLPADGNEHRVPAQGLSLFGVPAGAGETAFSGGDVVFTTPAEFDPTKIPDVCYRPLLYAGPGGGTQHLTQDFSAEAWKDRFGVAASTLGLPSGALNLAGLGDVVVPVGTHRAALPVPAAYAAASEVDLSGHYYLGELASSYGTVSSFFMRAIFTPDFWASGDGWGVMGWTNNRGALTINRQWAPSTGFTPAGTGGSVTTSREPGLIWPGTRNVVEMAVSLNGASSTCVVRFNGRVATHDHVFGANYTQTNITGTSRMFFGGSPDDGLTPRPLGLHSFEAWINQTDDTGPADVSFVSDGTNDAAILAAMTSI